MMDSIVNLRNKYGLSMEGVIHIGAHYGQEYSLYKESGIQNIIFIEPLPDKFEYLKQLSENCILFNTALGNFSGYVDMFVDLENKGASSSILSPKKHCELYPSITFSHKVTVPITTLDLLNFDRFKFDWINIDVQGYELEVFKGGVKTLETIKCIYTEMERDYLYENNSLIDELDGFLSMYGFIRKETWWMNSVWGEAFYIKQS